VAPGALYADAIVRAINECKVLLIVLSQNAVTSSHVGKEVERASSKHKQIIALRIESAPLTPPLALPMPMSSSGPSMRLKFSWPCR
jgi:hypothetical protein